MRRLVLAVLVAVASGSLTAPTAAQTPAFPPAKLTNLKFFPKDIPVRALLDTMRGFTRALGVRCAYCHVARDTAELASYDFASDDKATKRKARVMLGMAADINHKYLTKLPERVTPAASVTCVTCHRGVSVPRPIEQIVEAAYAGGGADSAEAAYRALRQRYYGRSAYDFGETPLAEVAGDLRSQGKLADAVRLYVLNTTFLPTSAFAHRQAAAGYLAAGDTAQAVSYFQKALTIDPSDRQARQALQRLRPGS
jgi:tetratricopeptide (TPR) repeat protein